MVSGTFSYTFQEHPSTIIWEIKDAPSCCSFPNPRHSPYPSTGLQSPLQYSTQTQPTESSLGQGTPSTIPIKAQSGFTSLAYSHHKLKRSPDLPIHLDACENALPPPPLLFLLLPPGAHPKGSSSRPPPSSVTRAVSHEQCHTPVACHFPSSLAGFTPTSMFGPLNRKEGLKSCPDTNPSKGGEKTSSHYSSSGKFSFSAGWVFEPTSLSCRVILQFR